MTSLRSRWLSTFAAVCACIVTFTFVAANAAEDNKPANASNTPKAQLDALVVEFGKAQERFMKQMGEAKTDEAREKITADMPPNQFAPRFAELIKANAKDPVAIEAAIQLAQAKPFGPELDEALKTVAEHHSSDEAVIPLFEPLKRGFTPGVEDFYRTLLEKSSSRNIQGQACLAAAQFLSALKENLASLPPPDSEGSKQAEKYLGKETLQQVRAIDREQLGKKAEAYLERAMKDFSDVTADGVSVAKRAERELKATRDRANLDIGKTAPDIEGEDVDGKTFKLSDYRGKVVVIDFWGDW